jgi:hypothetical protein
MFLGLIVLAAGDFVLLDAGQLDCPRLILIYKKLNLCGASAQKSRGIISALRRHNE